MSSERTEDLRAVEKLAADVRALELLKAEHAGAAHAETDPASLDAEASILLLAGDVAAYDWLFDFLPLPMLSAAFPGFRLAAEPPPRSLLGRLFGRAPTAHDSLHGWRPGGDVRVVARYDLETLADHGGRRRMRFFALRRDGAPLTVDVVWMLGGDVWRVEAAVSWHVDHWAEGPGNAVPLRALAAAVDSAMATRAAELHARTLRLRR